MTNTATTKTDWTLCALVYVAGLLAAAQFAKIALSLDALGVIYPDQVMRLPFLVSALSIMGIVFGATMGVIAARFGIGRVFCAGLAMAAAISFVQASFPALGVFFVLRVAEGMAHLAIVIAGPAIMATVAAQKDQPVVMGLWGTFFGVGFALTALAMPALLQLGPSSVFLAHGALLVLVLILAMRRVPQSGPQPSEKLGWLQRHVAIYRTPSVAAPALVFLWHTMMFLALLTFLPRWLGAWTAPVLPLVALIGTFGAGVLAKRYSPLVIAAWGYGASILLLGLLALSPEDLRVFVALPTLAVIGLAPGAAFATIPHLNTSASDRALSNGALAQLGNVGTAASVPVFAAVLHFGLPGLVVLAVLFSGIGMVISRSLSRRV